MKTAKPATRSHHPSRRQRASQDRPKSKLPEVSIPKSFDTVELRLGNRKLSLTNLRKPFWPELGITKGDLLQYYAEIAHFLLPHLHDRAMVMKRYPNGAGGEFFFMKRAPSPRPAWIELCSIEHASKNIIDFPVIQDLLSLLWVVNLGCIDLNQWYARCDDVDRPDYFHFDLDPVKGATFEQVLETGLVVREALETLEMPSFVKTTGSKRIAYLRPNRSRTQSEGSLELYQSSRAQARIHAPEAHYCGISYRETACATCAGGL